MKQISHKAPHSTRTSRVSELDVGFEDRRSDSRKGAKIAEMDENRIGKEIVDAAMAVHRELGPGLLETVHEVVLPDEIQKRGFRAERQVPIAIVCRGVRCDEGFRADIIVESKVIIGLRSVERITNAHKKQLLTCLKLTGMKLGYLPDFGEDMMKRGITRTVNGLPE
jgi:GxxExxY protein